MSKIAKDRTGEWYGHLEVLHRNGSNKRGDPLWTCKCHRCGAIVDIAGSHLKEKKNCGCKQREKQADLSGRVFGALAVLQKTGTDNNGNALYLCKCNLCGQEKEFPATTIRKEPIGCGCQEHSPEKMLKLSLKAKGKIYKDNTNISQVFSVKATVKSKTGVRGVFKVRGKFRASVQVAKERVTQDFDTIEEATEFRDKMHKELIEKHQLEKYRSDESE